MAILFAGANVFAFDDEYYEFEFGDIEITFDDGFFDMYQTASFSYERVSARVIEVKEIVTRPSLIFPDQEETMQLLVVEVLEGERRGQELETTHFLTGDQENSMRFDVLRVGDRVYVSIDERGEVAVGYVDGVQRQRSLLVLLCIFLVLILIIGRVKGIQTIASLMITIGTIFLYTLPALFRGNDPIFTAIISCIGITIVSFLVISGFRKKTAVAIIGTVFGFAIAGILAIVFSSAARMSGFNEDTMHLMFIPGETGFNLVGLMFAGIIIGALGVCMDVAMSIASALWELKKESPNIERKALFTAGMNIGKDAMGTMSNTLILAYVGSLITIIMMFMAHNTEFIQIINIEIITEEIIKGLTGSIGLITVIPITSYISALLYGRD